MDEEEYLASLLEKQFVEEPAPPDPLPAIVQDVFFNVDNVTGTVGIGTSQAIGARVHIISKDPFPAVRILQKGTGDVLLIDNKDIPNQNDPPKTPYFNIKNDGRIGIGTTVPLAELHLVTEKEGDILIGSVIGTGPLVSQTDAGAFFTLQGNNVSSGVFTEVDGLLVDLAANVEQVGVVDTSRVGGIIRLDTRKLGEYSSDLGDYNSFTLKGYPIGMGTTGEYNVLTANLDTADINIAPVKGKVYVGAYSSTTSLGIATDIIDDQYRLYVNGNAGIVGTLSLPDYSKITVGILSDFSIYHDPITNNSYLIETNPLGNLVIAGDDIEFKTAGLAKTYAYFRSNDAVELYYNNEKKFETNLDGILVGSIGISTVGIISGPAEIVLDPATVGDNTGIVRIKGDLFVDGTTTQIYSTVVTIADIRVGIASTVSDTAFLNNAGIEIGIGPAQKTLTYNALSDSLKSSENFDLAEGKLYKIGGNEVLSISTVSASVTTSSLQEVGILQRLRVSGLTTTQDLLVVGFATIPNVSVNSGTFTNAVVSGTATIGFGNIQNLNVGTAATIPFGNITNLNSSGISTINNTNIGIATIGVLTVTDHANVTNLSVGTTDNTPFGQVGILTVGAIAPPYLGQITSPNIGSERQVLTALGSNIFNSTGVGLTWTEFSLASVGGTTGIGVSTIDTNTVEDYFITSYPRSGLLGGVAVAATFYTSNLRYNELTNRLLDEVGNFRAIPPRAVPPVPGPGITTVGASDVGRHIVVYDSVDIINGQFEVGDAITLINRNNVSINIFMIGGTGGGGGGATSGFYLAGGLPTQPLLTQRSLAPFGLITLLCILRTTNQNNTIINQFIISGTN